MIQGRQRGSPPHPNKNEDFTTCKPQGFAKRVCLRSRSHLTARLAFRAFTPWKYSGTVTGAQVSEKAPILSARPVGRDERACRARERGAFSQGGSQLLEGRRLGFHVGSILQGLQQSVLAGARHARVSDDAPRAPPRKTSREPHRHRRPWHGPRRLHHHRGDEDTSRLRGSDAGFPVYSWPAPLH